MRTVKTPCLDCPDRHLHCHAECEAYKAFSEERAIKNQQNRDAYTNYTKNTSRWKWSTYYERKERGE